MTLKRRDVLKFGIAAGGVLASPLALQNAASAQRMSPPVTTAPTSQQGAFVSPLSVPPVLDYTTATHPGVPNPETGEDPGDVEVDYYEINMVKANQTINGEPVQIWGYNGIMPGPTIIRRKDVEAVVRFKNNIGQDDNGENVNCVIHLHGMASLPEYDGYADDFIPPNYYKDYHYPNDRSATIWYHDHMAARTQRNVGMGLAGMYIIEGDDEVAANEKLPSTYGDNDIPLILQVNPKYVTSPNNIAKAQFLLINGEQQPYFEVDRRNYRFRILNATDTVGVTLTITDLSGSTRFQPFQVIGTDGGLMLTPDSETELRMGMGERYEVVIDFDQIYNNLPGSGTKTIYLVNKMLGDNGDPTGGNYGLMAFNIKPGSVSDTSYVPSVLRTGRPYPTAACAESALEFIFNDNRTDTLEDQAAHQGIQSPTPGCTISEGYTKITKVWAINEQERITNGGKCADGQDPESLDGSNFCPKTWMDGEPLSPKVSGNSGDAPTTSTTLPNVDGRIVAKPNVGEVQIWRLMNTSGNFHPVHIHLLDTYMLSREHRGAGGGWQVTNERKAYENNWKDVYFLKPNERITVIGRYGPFAGQYMWHCHNLLHEDCDMMAEFELQGPNPHSPFTDPAMPLSSAPTLTSVLPKYPYDLVIDYNDKTYGNGADNPTYCEIKTS